MIRARLTFRGKDAGVLGLSIEPDNLPEMAMTAEAECLIFEFSARKIGTMLATLDDLLMNLKIAEETMVCGEKR